MIKMKNINDIINNWQEEIEIINQLIGSSNPDNDMLCIMIARKNQLGECIKDLEKLPKENSIRENKCRKKILTKEMADKIVCRDELKGLNTGRKNGLNRSAYYCDECKGWHTTTMIDGIPSYKISKTINQPND